MDTRNTADVDRRSLLKGAAVGLVGAGIGAAAAVPAAAQDRGAVKDPKLLTEMVTYKSGGDTINAFLARPREPGRYGAVIVVPDIFGMSDYIKETTSQVAQAGLVALCPDFYSRKGGAPQTTDFAVIRAFVSENAPDPQIVGDMLAGIDYLKGRQLTNGKFGITGFCMGGRVTLLVAAKSPDIVAASPYYGGVRAGGPTQMAPMDVVGDIKAAVQGHYGAEDRAPSPEQVREFYAKLKETNPNAEFHIYEGAGHAFHSFGRPSFRPEAARQAWDRTLAFFQKHLK